MRARRTSSSTSTLKKPWCRIPNLDTDLRRVNVDFPEWMIDELDREAKRVGNQPPGGHQDLDRRAHRPHARLPLGVGAHETGLAPQRARCGFVASPSAEFYDFTCWTRKRPIAMVDWAHSSTARKGATVALPAADLSKQPDNRTTMELGAVLPLTAEVRDDHLFVGGVDMVELAREQGTALYVMDESDMRTAHGNLSARLPQLP